MNYILIFHANLNYAYLSEHRYEFVIRKSYELTIDTMRQQFPDTKYVFEASGFTIEQIALKTPDVLEKLKSAIQIGQCEFMGSPYAHPMLANFPEEDGLKIGSFATFDEACKLPALKEEVHFDNDSAWHGAKASTWANTPMAKLLRPWQELVREKLHASSHLSEEAIKRCWYYLTNSYNSDGQWPPTLSDAPHIIYPYNYKYCFDNLLAAEQIVGGTDREQISADPVKTLDSILSLQAKLILQKAENLSKNGTETEQHNANLALALIKNCLDFSSVKKSGAKILYPAEYECRANMLIEARRLVGGVNIEKII